MEFWSGFLSGMELDFEFLSPFYDRILPLTDRQRRSGVGQILERTSRLKLRQSQTIFYDLKKNVNIHSVGVGVNSYHTG